VTVFSGQGSIILAAITNLTKVEKINKVYFYQKNATKKMEKHGDIKIVMIVRFFYLHVGMMEPVG
jgi:hypothetical protein